MTATLNTNARLPIGHQLGIGGQVNWNLDGGVGGMITASYTVPFAVPIGRIEGLGDLSGVLLDVNGEPVQLWVLRPGDIIALGRTVMVYGTREEIAERLASLRESKISGGVTLDTDEFAEGPSAASLDFELNFANDPDAEVVLHTLAPPELPEGLSPGQAAQMAEILQYLHLRMRGLVQTVRSKDKGDRITLEQHRWQNLVDLQDLLSNYLRKIGEPEA